ncbi:unnamed protein product [Phaedon cochleariae]|uniref:Uncharacterized protein n=1 Tax=Phaedon cochleariae TaxID=80249 RepID=A0A9N9SMZ5_PHACE|nr:unnamed protein product [Phaedon cochleariae]
MIYKAQFRPVLEYGFHIWNAAPKHTLKLLDSVQKRAIRLVGDASLTNSLTSLEHRRKVGDLALFYRYIHGRCSSEISTNVFPSAVPARLTRRVEASHPFLVILETCRTYFSKYLFIQRIEILPMPLRDKFPSGPRTFGQPRNLDSPQTASTPQTTSTPQDTHTSQTAPNTTTPPSRRRRSVTVSDRRARSADVGVSSLYDVISEADLAFSPDGRPEAVAVFQGRIREEVVYGVCMPVPGFSLLFVLVAVSAVVSALVAGSLLYRLMKPTVIILSMKVEIQYVYTTSRHGKGNPVQQVIMRRCSWTNIGWIVTTSLSVSRGKTAAGVLGPISVGSLLRRLVLAERRQQVIFCSRCADKVLFCVEDDTARERAPGDYSQQMCHGIALLRVAAGTRDQLAVCAGRRVGGGRIATLSESRHEEGNTAQQVIVYRTNIGRISISSSLSVSRGRAAGNFSQQMCQKSGIFFDWVELEQKKNSRYFHKVGVRQALVGARVQLAVRADRRVDGGVGLGGQIATVSVIVCEKGNCRQYQIQRERLAEQVQDESGSIPLSAFSNWIGFRLLRKNCVSVARHTGCKRNGDAPMQMRTVVNGKAANGACSSQRD